MRSEDRRSARYQEAREEGVLIHFLTAWILAAGPAAPAGTPAPVDTAALTEELVANLEKTVAAADADIVSEIEAGGYRIGLVLGAARPMRSRMASGVFPDSVPSDPSLTFVGIVLREPRTKRFLPNAVLKVNLEVEGAGENLFYELTGPYPIYGENVSTIKKPGTVVGPNGIDDLRAITVTVEPPAYARHAEMLATFAAPAVARFEIVPRPGAKGPPWHMVKDPVKPKPIADDWKIGDDLRQGVGETRSIVRSGSFALGFIAEGPEPIWLWQGSEHPPECLAVRPDQNTHLELMLVHVPTGLMVTGADVRYAFWRRSGDGTGPREEKEFRLFPLMAEFFHYGLTADVPPGSWNVTAQVTPPRMIGQAWGSGEVPIPEQRVGANFQYTREAPTSEGPAAEAARLGQRLEDAAARYRTGDREAAHKEATEAFFAFEASGVNATIRASNRQAYKSLERDWIELRDEMRANAPPDEVAADAKSISDRLIAAVPAGPDGATAGSAFVQSFLVLLREGFEAILILGLLAAVLRKTGRPEGLKLLWGGSIAGLAASAVLAALLLLAFQSVNAGKARETFEGVTMLFAVVVLFFTSFWLISRVEGRRWAAFLKQQMQAALSTERRFGIASLAFLVVFREGAETVLLYASLFSVASGAAFSILAGIAVAAVILVVLFVLSNRGGAAIPVRPFFAITGALLYVFAFKLAGDGISELQNVEIVGRTTLEWIPDSAALQSWLGIYPTVQTAAVQGVLLLAVIAGLGWTMLRRPEEPAAQSGAAVR